MNRPAPALSRETTKGNTVRTPEELVEMEGATRRGSMPPSKVRDRAPGLHWHGEYARHELQKGRCLMIEYLRTARKVRAEEIHDIAALQRPHPRKPNDNVTLRLFHVQNWPEAIDIIARKFRLHDRDDSFSALPGFMDWVVERRPRRRAGKPLLTAKTWKVSADPWRQITRCAVGWDVLKIYPCGDRGHNDLDRESRVTGLMGYDANDNPVHYRDVYSQRISMYVQANQPDLHVPGPEIMYAHPHNASQAPKFDNGNTIIIFDNSESHNIMDTLIPARGDFESKWRRLPFYVTNAVQDAEADDELNASCMRIVTQDVFKAIARNWDQVLDTAWESVSILEDKIYEQPADESRAPELWKNQAKWLVFEKLIYAHQEAVQDMRQYLVELDGDMSDAGQWLTESPADFQRIGNLLEEDLLKRTNNLSELMYKSVAIRDSRESLRLGASMWRLSWITFLFLPLNCLIAFFGMNVDILANNPSIKWVFITAVPFLFLVLIMWYALKHSFTTSSYTPLARIAYEQLFTELQAQRPEIWTRQGPREYIQPADALSQWKWWWIQKWTASDALPKPPSTDDEPIGGWNRIKRMLIRKWSPEINIVESKPLNGDIEEGAEGSGDFSGKEKGRGETVVAALRESVDPATVVAAGDLSEITPSEGGSSFDAEDPRNSGILVEENAGGDEWKQVHDGKVEHCHATGPSFLEAPKSTDWAARKKYS